LLTRYGVVVRDVLDRETVIPRWRELVGIFRRLEARGEIRGGRFVSGFGGEQFALPDAVASLREFSREQSPEKDVVRVAAADPMNLAGILVPGERVPAMPGKNVTFKNGIVDQLEAVVMDEIRLLADASPGQLSLAESKNDGALSI
jgi:ATP-dependent helicase Lhr and Lhr-like helicase